MEPWGRGLPDQVQDRLALQVITGLFWIQAFCFTFATGMWQVSQVCTSLCDFFLHKGRDPLTQQFSTFLMLQFLTLWWLPYHKINFVATSFLQCCYCHESKCINIHVFWWSWVTPVKGSFDLKGVATPRLRTGALGPLLPLTSSSHSWEPGSLTHLGSSCSLAFWELFPQSRVFAFVASPPFSHTNLAEFLPPSPVVDRL